MITHPVKKEFAIYYHIFFAKIEEIQLFTFLSVFLPLYSEECQTRRFFLCVTLYSLHVRTRVNYHNIQLSFIWYIIPSSLSVYSRVDWIFSQRFLSNTGTCLSFIKPLLPLHSIVATKQAFLTRFCPAWLAFFTIDLFFK